MVDIYIYFRNEEEEFTMEDEEAKKTECKEQEETKQEETLMFAKEYEKK